MRLVGLMPVRNEAWCLGFTLRIALRWCDAVVVYLHASTDESLQIVADVQSEVTDRIVYFRDADPLWREMDHRQQMLTSARSELGATHIAIVDADEFLTANIVPETFRSAIEATPPRYMLELPGYNLRNGIFQYHNNGIWGSNYRDRWRALTGRWFATAFADDSAAHWGGDQFHHREPHGVSWRRWRPIQQGSGGTLHLWGASERRLRAKHALYKITERLRWPEKPVAEIERYYSLATTPNPHEPWTFAPVPAEWIEPYQDWMQYLDVDAEPWQAAEVKRLVEQYGTERFIGLDLLGVPEW